MERRARVLDLTALATLAALAGCVERSNIKLPSPPEAAKSMLLVVDDPATTTIVAVFAFDPHADTNLALTVYDGLGVTALYYSSTLEAMQLEPGRVVVEGEGRTIPPLYAPALRTMLGGIPEWSESTPPDHVLNAQISAFDFDRCAQSGRCIEDSTLECVECHPLAPEDPRAPELPCPAGAAFSWTRDGAGEDGLETCTPKLPRRRTDACERAEAQPIDREDCARIADVCPTERWPAVNATPPILYVDAAATSTAPDGTITAPFRTLANALENAPSGSTIVLARGVESGPITVTTSSIAIIGACPEESSIDGGASAVAVDLPARDVRLENLTVRGGETGIRVRAPNVVLSRLIVEAPRLDGIVVESEARIERVLVRGSTRDGIFVSNGGLRLHTAWIESDGGVGLRCTNATLDVEAIAIRGPASNNASRMQGVIAVRCELEINEMLLEDHSAHGIYGEESQITAGDLIIRRIQPLARPGEVRGSGVAMLGGRTELSRTLIEDTVSEGILTLPGPVSDHLLILNDVITRGVRRNDMGIGTSIALGGGSDRANGRVSAMMSRVLVEGSPSLGVYAGVFSETVTLADAIVRHDEEQSAHSVLLEAVSADVRRISIAGASGTGVFIAERTETVTLEDLRVARVAKDGVYVKADRIVESSVTLRRVLVEDAGEVGIQLAGSVNASLEDIQVRDMRGPTFGLLMTSPARIVLDRFSILHQTSDPGESVGLQYMEQTFQVGLAELAISNGELRGHGIGSEIVGSRLSLGLFLNRVRYQENTTAIHSSK